MPFSASSAEPAASNLPQAVLLRLIDSTASLEIDHATKFSHVNVPQHLFNAFLSYVKDTVSAEVPGLSAPVYYHFTMRDGSVINGDVCWNEQNAYIVFKVGAKKYVNAFSREGVTQIKTIFKL